MSFAFVDHFVYAAPDLGAAVDDLEARLGVRLSEGGVHVGLGTANALLALGEGTYLEVIGPNPEAPEPERPRPFGIDALDVPRLVTWATASPDIKARCEAAKRDGFDPGTVVDMARKTPSGDLLEWQLTIRPWQRKIEPVPFLIDWGRTQSPGVTLPVHVKVKGFQIADPEIEAVNGGLKALGLSIRAEAGDAAKLEVTLEGPEGPVVLS